MKRKSRNHSAAFKAKVALAALKGDKIPAALAEPFEAHGNPMMQGKSRLPKRASDGCATAAERNKPAGPDVEELQAKIARLAVENDL